MGVKSKHYKSDLSNTTIDPLYLSKILTICTTIDSFDKIAKLIDCDPMIFGTFGIHPHESSKDLVTKDEIVNNIKKPLVIGHSLGGKVAMKLAFTHAEILDKLLIADISPRRYNTDFHFYNFSFF